MKYTIRSFIAICLLSLTSLSTQASVDPGEEHFIIFYHHDALGSPAAVSDQNGNVLWHEHNAPYGETRARLLPNGEVLPKEEDYSGERLGYTGHELDRDTDLVYMKARYYDPVIGRLYSNDPIGFTIGNPMMFNRYAYANNNPYKYIDPTGMMSDDDSETDDDNDPFGDATVVGDSMANAASTVGDGMSAAGDALEPSWLDAIGLGIVSRFLKGRKLARNIGSDVADADVSKAVPESVDPKTLIGRQNSTEMSSNQVKRLRRDMRENGYDSDEPIEVADVNGRLIILDGHHRTQGAIGAGIREVPVNINQVTREQADQLMNEAAEATLR